MKKLLFIILLIFGLIFQLSAQEATTNWSLWVIGNYTGFDNYIPKVAEFNRGVEGFTPELGFKVKHFKDQNGVSLKGWYYDPKRMVIDIDGHLGNMLKAKVSYKSFYRQLQLDYLANLSAVENGATKPGGKLLTHELINPDENLGYKRQEIETNVEFKIPGLEQLKLFAAHRSVIDEGKEQHVQNTHCSQCHVVSRPIELKRNTNTISGGFEADLDIVNLSYKLSRRTFKSDADHYTAFYDTIRHPRSEDPKYYAIFQGRSLYGGENVAIAGYPETEKMSHKITAKANLGKGKLILQYVNMHVENKNIMNESFNVNGALAKEVIYTGKLELTGNTFRLNYATPLFKKTKLIASGLYSRYKNEPIAIDAPPWMGISDSGFINVDMDYTRYSAMTRTDMGGSLKFIYQPTRRYRLSLLGGFSTREREDYPNKGAKDKTTKMRLEIGARYKPSMEFTGRFKYGIESIDNPFSPYDLMFEQRGRGTLEAITATTNGGPDKAKHIYYYQRDQLRYGEVTMLPNMVHKIGLDLSYNPTQTVKLNAGLNATLGSNDDAPQLDFSQKMIQPKLGLTFVPDENLMFYGNYSYVMRSQNGLATIALMDG